MQKGRKSGLGTVARDFNGRVERTWAVNCPGIADVKLMEGSAIRKAILQAHKLSWKHIHIESDVLGVINMYGDGFLSNYVDDISLLDIKIKDVYSNDKGILLTLRDANSAEATIAKITRILGYISMANPCTSHVSPTRQDFRLMFPVKTQPAPRRHIFAVQYVNRMKICSSSTLTDLPFEIQEWRTVVELSEMNRVA
ncbi:hypothetical protein ACH5RR_000921 [Cinchona calisaya]|uniref:RNase H type-1 domain-containing protein n=1 Tax=Cinchona calisaya TaxID=153742 RepID=A0ABD3B200_9GENT